MSRAEAAGDDVATLQAAARGDVVAVRALIAAAGPTVYGFVLARLGGDEATAEDLVQETFMEAVRSASTFRGDAALSTWMCAIARRRLARHFERERRDESATRGLTVIEGGAGASSAMAATEDQDAVDARDELLRALGRLSVLHRQVLVRKYLDNESVAAIASELDRTNVQVQSLLQRARDALRRAVEEGRR